MSISVRQVLIAHATWHGDAAQVQAMDLALNSKLVNTRALLASWRPLGSSHHSGDSDWASPSERFWAQAAGWLPETSPATDSDNSERSQPLPLAALELGDQLPPNLPAAWLSPVHVLASMNDVRLSHPNHLQLSEAHSNTLLEALKPLCAEDGVDLSYVAPQRWLLAGERLRGIVSPSMSLAYDQPINDYLPFSTSHPASAQWLRRLQNEAQMLFYTHPVHDERLALGLQPVTGIWLHGAGAIAEHRDHSHISRNNELAQHAHQPFDWQAAWAALDAGTMATLLGQGQTQAFEVCFASHNGITRYASPALSAAQGANKTPLLQRLSHTITHGWRRLAPTLLPSALAPQ